MDSRLTGQQKFWIGTVTILKAIRPLLLYIFVPAMTLAVGYVLGHSDMSMEEFFTYGSNFYTAIGMLLTLAILYRSAKRLGLDAFTEKERYLEALKPLKAAGFLGFGFAAAFAWSALLTLLPQVGVMASYTAASTRSFAGRDVFFSLFTSMFTAPIVEEVIFRGCMLNTLLETFRTKTSILIVTAIFALCHGNAVWILYAFLMGLLLAHVAMKEDNILYNMCMHIGFNLPAGVIWLIGRNEALSQALFGHKLLIAAYGLIGLFAALLLADLYRHPERRRFRRR